MNIELQRSKMNLNTEKEIEWSYYEESDITNESEYLYEEDYNTQRTRNAINPGEYVHDDDNGEYVLEKKNVKKNSNPTKDATPGYAKPGHKKTDPNVYDELDYDLSPRIEMDTGVSKASHGQINSKKDSNKRKILIASVAGICILAAVVTGIGFGLQGKHRFYSTSKSNNILEKT